MTMQPPPRDPDDQPSPWDPPRDDQTPRDQGDTNPYFDHPKPDYGPPPHHPSVYRAPGVNVYAAPPTVSNGVATAGGVCGIVAAAISWIPLVNFASLVLSILAVALGGVGLARANRLQREVGRPVGKGMAITGIVIGAVGLVAAVLFIAALGSALSEFGNTTNT